VHSSSGWAWKQTRVATTGGRYRQRAAREPVGGRPERHGTVTVVPEGGPNHAAWSLMRRAIRPHHSWVLVGVVLGLVWTGARVVVPLLVRGAIDHGIEQDDQKALLLWCAAIAAVGTVQAVATGFRRYSAFLVARRAETDLRDRMFAHLQGMHFAYH